MLKIIFLCKNNRKLFFQANLVVFILCSSFKFSYSQQDINFTISNQFFAGKKIIKVKKDFNDPYVWVLAANDEVYRINSVDQTVTDYTSTFSNYNNLQFIDIAGRSSDSVFVATNSPNFIQYENGNLQLMGSNIGIKDTVTSIGINYSNNGTNFQNKTAYNDQNIFVGTVDGTYGYNSTTQNNAILISNNYYGKVYEATYRATIFCGYYLYDPPGDTIFYHSMVFDAPYEGFGYAVWQSANKYGLHLNTTYYVTPFVYNYEAYVEYADDLWGSEKGLFQVRPNNSNTDAEPFNQYLPNINVTKITSILGLTTFGNLNDPNAPGFVRNNLLAGTSAGLYFSTSAYDQVSQNGLIKYTFFHYDPLGNQPINDIYVNNASISPICENGVWVATNNGLYYLTPSYANSLVSQQLDALSFKNQPDTLSYLQLCAGSNATAIVNFSGNLVQWYQNGVQIPNANADTLRITIAGDYYASLIDPCSNEQVQSNHLKVNYLTDPVFSFNYPSVISNCNNTPVPLHVTDNSPSDLYRWYKNGVLDGNTTTTQTVTQSGKYYAEISSCSGTWVATNAVEVNLVNLPVPNITGDKVTYCQGDGATLLANVPVDPSYTINWYLNNALIAANNNLPQITTTSAGNYSITISSNISTCSNLSVVYPLSFTAPPTFTFNYPATLNYCLGSTVTLKVQGSTAYQYEWFKNGNLIADATTNELPISQTGSYNVQVSACPGSWVPVPNAVQVNFVATPIPAISSDKQAYCQGDNAILSIFQSNDPAFTVNWYMNNIRLPNDDGKFNISTNIAGTYTVVLVSNYTDQNGIPCSSTSAPVAISFDAPQQVSIQETADNGLCAGQSVALKAIYTGGSVQWSTGETSDQISVTTSGTYSVTLTTPPGCQSSKDITIAFLPDPVLAQINDAPLCVYKKESVMLTAPPGFTEYNWNGQNGGQSYTVSQPQVVNLIVTDANGCQASEKINVYAECPDVEIPNTFTPNGDNINDTWVIEGLDNTATVSIFTRYGIQIYKSTGGYATPWDGSYNGKKVSSGTYYYIITTRGGKNKYSGFVMVVY